MAIHTQKQRTRVAVITLMVFALLVAAAFNLQKMPGLAGSEYHAEFTDASGLRVGNRVEIAGIKVGRVSKVRIDGAKVVVDFEVKDEELGDETEATIGVHNLLGEKYLDLKPSGEEEISADGTIPLDRTRAGYDIVGTLSQLTETTEEIDTKQLSTALTTLADTMDHASPHIQDSFDGLSRLSRTIASRDQDLEKMLTNTKNVVSLVNDRKRDLIGLMKHGQGVFEELVARRDAIHALLVNATALSKQLQGLVKDNEKQIGPALAELNQSLDFLNERKDDLSATIENYGPYASILTNIIGTGPWFDAYLGNLTGLVTGEFLPGKRPGLE